MTAGGLLSRDGGLKDTATHVILVPLLSIAPNTVIVLLRRFSVALSSSSGVLSSNPLCRVLISTGRSLTFQSMSVAIAVQETTAVLLSVIFRGSGGVIISVEKSCNSYSYH